MKLFCKNIKNNKFKMFKFTLGYKFVTPKKCNVKKLFGIGASSSSIFEIYFIKLLIVED